MTSHMLSRCVLSELLNRSCVSFFFNYIKSRPLEDEDIMDSLGLPEVEAEYEFPVEAQQAISKIRRHFISSEGGKIKGEKKGRI